MKLKKIFALALSCVMAVGVLTGCGGSGSDAAPVKTAKEAADALLAANPISNQLALDDNTVSLDIALPEDSYTEYAGALSNDQSDAGRVIVIAYADGQETVVTDALEAYRQNQVVFFGNYPEFADAQAHLEDDYALVSGNGLAVLAVASNECTDVDAMVAAAEGLVG